MKKNTVLSEKNIYSVLQQMNNLYSKYVAKKQKKSNEPKE